tara:strand:- start:4586 stop:7246 length:2661 start_codon:yes stop_codon:yes gene_type:complete
MAKQFIKTITHQEETYTYYSLRAVAERYDIDLASMPYSYKIILENLVRHETSTALGNQIDKLTTALDRPSEASEIEFTFTRILLQDFTGVPVIADLAAMRDGVVQLGGNPGLVKPKCPVDLVIDHSVQVQYWKNNDAYLNNVNVEVKDNIERYKFLKWGQQAFNNLRVVPPGIGICHQVNLEYLAKVVWNNPSEKTIYFDSLVGTDSHTTMINALGVLGWGVGGIEAESAMLGRPVSFKLPTVVGLYLSGQLPEGVTGTDLVLTITQQLRRHGCVGKFVEFCGPGLENIDLAERATISNMAPEYGATCALFPIDHETINYLKLTNRSSEAVSLIEFYAKEQDLWHQPDHNHSHYNEFLKLDLSAIKPCVAGPVRPQDRVLIESLPSEFINHLNQSAKEIKEIAYPVPQQSFTLSHGDIVIAAITSCTNTSNPDVLIAAGLLAKRAVEAGLSVPPWVKCSFAPGSQVVTTYLDKLNLTPYLEKLGFFLVGYGCTTCIGNSGPLDPTIAQAIDDHDIITSSVLSGNRNFEGRIHSHVRANWLASPPLVVAYAIAGTVRIDITKQPLGMNSNNQPVFLKDIWPHSSDIEQQKTVINHTMFEKKYAQIFQGDENWLNIPSPTGKQYAWDNTSTYIKQPTFFDNITTQPADTSAIKQARILALLGQSITTDHISPAGSIRIDSPAGVYLRERGVQPSDFNTYGSRRGNHEVMVRGTFANIRVKNKMVPDVEGGYTIHHPSGEQLTIYDAAERYAKENTPLVIFAGAEYGTGSSRDWAAKGTLMLGVKAIICESFERIHRTNLIGMGVLPCRLTNGTTTDSLNLQGDELIDIDGIESIDEPNAELSLIITRSDLSTERYPLLCCIETRNEITYYKHQGILSFMLRNMASDTP